jgi:hypothetical protein
MSRTELSASAQTNEIKGISVFDENDPTVTAGSKLVASVNDGVTQTGTNVGINGNFIKIRNYVNKLRVDVDAWVATIADASAIVAGKINLVAQAFSGEKAFYDSISVGKANTVGFVKIFNATNALYAMLKASVTGSNKTLFLPDRDNETLATTVDVAAKQSAFIATDNLQIARIDATTLRIRNAGGNYMDITVPTAAFNNGALKFPAISGTVVVKPTAFLAPFNARIVSITNPSYIDEAVSIAKDYSGKFANVLVKWCLENLGGIGDNNSTFTFTGVPAFDLTGYYIYFPSLSRNLKIASMNGAIATLTSEEGLSTAVGSCLTGALPYAHCNANSYELVAMPYNPVTEALDPFNAIIATQSYTVDSIAQTSAMLRLELGVRYHILIAAVFGDSRSEYGSVPLVESAYYLIKYGDVSATNAAVTATPTRAGFRINIAALADAEAFQVCYTADGTADFANVNHQKIISSSKVIDIAVSDSRTYSIKVRPIIGGQVVGTTYSASVVSGAGGALPSDQCILTVPVNIRTYSGTIAYDAETTVATLSAIVTPSGGATSVSKLGEGLVGSVLKDSANHEFLVSECLDTNVFLLKNISTNAFTPTAGTFEINTTKRGRTVFYGELNKIDYDITLVSFDCDLQVRYNSVLRWWQSANEDAYDSIGSINASDKEFKKDTDLHVYSSNDVSNGTRVFVIDFWDAGGAPENRGGVTGAVSIYGRPRSTANNTVVS